MMKSIQPSRSSMPQVALLKPGSMCRDESGRILDARSSVALIVSGSMRIIVDTGLQGEDAQITGALAHRGLYPSDIELLVNTHSHPDHTGCNHLFSNANLLHPCEGCVIAPHVTAIRTPGHSIDSISIVVSACGRCKNERIVIAGDALPTFDNYLKNVPPALHVNRNTAIASMERILGIADIVIPGHDMPFSLRERKYVKLLY
jgi:glyoxylase-like metal-dependent hydrolase (beta-lactamase superfamily II)